MTDLQILDERTMFDKTFRMYGTPDEPLFLAKDVAEWIEHSDVSTMLRTVPEDEKLTQTMFVSGQNRDYWCLTEDGLYEVLMQSRKPIAKSFKKEVKNILKTIRKHGAYMTPQKIEEVLLNPDTIIQLATLLKEAQTKSLLLEQRVAEYEPKVQYLDQILTSKGTLTITQIAADYGMTAYQLNKMLFMENIQRKVNGQWILYKEHMNLGYTKSETINFIHSDGTPDTKLNTRFTQKGRLMIHGILTAKGIKANIDRKTA
jgi:phage antirepressor YoqD-like protein